MKLVRIPEWGPTFFAPDTNSPRPLSSLAREHGCKVNDAVLVALCGALRWRSLSCGHPGDARLSDLMPSREVGFDCIGEMTGMGFAGPDPEIAHHLDLAKFHGMRILR